MGSCADVRETCVCVCFIVCVLRASMCRFSSAWEGSQTEAGYPTSFWKRYLLEASASVLAIYPAESPHSAFHHTQSTYPSTATRCPSRRSIPSIPPLQSRVVTQIGGERNFHIFYQLITGADEQTKGRVHSHAQGLRPLQSSCWEGVMTIFGMNGIM